LRSDLSVVICTHNPHAGNLRRTLNALREQTLPLEKWELLLIDNASAQPLVSSWDLSWHPHARHIAESKLGLSAARQRGIQEAASELLVFVDDDNVLGPNYLLKALTIKRDWPLLGSWGAGTIIPEFELQPSKYLYRNDLTHYLALRESPTPRWTNLAHCHEAIPYGAGLCLRKHVASAYLNHCRDAKITLTDRRGTSLAGGGDLEISYVACSIGLGMGVFPELKVVHLIRKERVAPRYLRRIFEEAETSDALLAYKWRGILPESPLRLYGLLSILKNLTMRRQRDPRLYLATVRARISARRTIASSLSAISTRQTDRVG
jgi:hypothetical protein